MGHSALTGESSDPGRPGRAAEENSWATGTSPNVLSVYQQLVAARPENAGHVDNEAAGGATAFKLPAQAVNGLGVVPAPQLVIIETIDNDIRCDGTDDANVPRFGSAIATTLDTITQRSPNSAILIVGQPGRPADDVDAIAQVPSAKAMFTGTGPCDFFDPAGDRVDANIANLTSIIEKYETEQARVCSKYPQCHTDGGAFAASSGWFADVASDGNHLTTHGLSRVAALAWPIVQQILGLH